jgi:hypothetical protein
VTFDCVVSYHQNVHTCGVARFNRRLAGFLGVPMVSIEDLSAARFVHPLVSVKFSEMQPRSIESMLEALGGRYSVVLHGYSGSLEEASLASGATRVMALSRKMAEEIRHIRTDVVVGFAPGSSPIDRTTPVPELKLITFGMAHKIQSAGYRRAGDLLVADGREFVLEISSALHEGTEFDDQFFDVGEEISACFAGRVEFLGFLADAEVSRRLTAADALLAFFPDGVRENNTSVATAMNHGLAVITNLDEWSPDWMVHGRTIFDVSRLDEFPSSDSLRSVGRAGAEAIAGFDYRSLMALLRKGL